MNKLRFATFLFCVILTICARHGWAQPYTGQLESEQSSTSNFGRDNPFAKITKKKTSIPEVKIQSSQSALDAYESPEVFIETITLKFLDAAQIRQIISTMSSENGSIAVNSKTNSLVVCDTKKNLAKIIGKIRDADKKPEQIMIEVVLLDVQLDNDTEIGINWYILSTKM